MAVSQEEFRYALSHFASGVCVVTTVDKAGKQFGITVSAFCSVSLDPALILVCIERSTASHYAFGESEVFIVNILSEDQRSLSEHFATPFPNKFSEIPHRITDSGVPALDGTIATIECRLHATLDGGDHSIFLGRVEEAHIRGGRPLIYFRSDYHDLTRTS